MVEHSHRVGHFAGLFVVSVTEIMSSESGEKSVKYRMERPLRMRVGQLVGCGGDFGCFLSHNWPTCQTIFRIFSNIFDSASEVY